MAEFLTLQACCDTLKSNQLQSGFGGKLWFQLPAVIED